jgi:hypothetical protein
VLAGLLLAIIGSFLAEGLSDAQGDTVKPAPATEASSSYSSVKYVMTAKLDPLEHRVHGVSTITWTNKSSKAQQELWLHLYLNAFKNERSVFMRSTAGGSFRGGDRPKQWGYVSITKLRAMDTDLKVEHSEKEDETDAKVSLPRSVAPGETLTLNIEWVSQLPSVTHRTGFGESFHMVGQWFPKLAVLEPNGRWEHFPFHRLSEFYADYGDYDVTISAPKEFVVGATGRLVEAKSDGDLIRHRYVQKNVHDFAFTAWDGFAEAKRNGPGGVEVRCLYPKGEDGIANLEMDMVVLGLEHYGKAYGAYPYETLTIVHPPAAARDAGGMEYPTLITTGGSWLGGLMGLRGIEGVTLHELAHQWFYGMVGSNEYKWAFLDEGFTTWATMRLMEEHFGAGAGIDGPGLQISHSAFMRANAAAASGIDQIGQRANRFALGKDYGRLVYSRTAVLVESVRRSYGVDKLDAAMGAYARKFRYGHPTPEDFIAAIKTGVGKDAADVMRAGLLDNGWVDYEIATIRNEKNDAPQGIYGNPDSPDAAPKVEGGQYRATIVVRHRGDLAFPVEIELHSESGLVQRTPWDGKGEHFTITWTGDAKLKAAVVDPDNHVLIDGDLSNNTYRTSRQNVAPRVLTHVGYITQVLMGLVAP